jgi:hypothetical protein
MFLYENEEKFLNKTRKCKGLDNVRITPFGDVIQVFNEFYFVLNNKELNIQFAFFCAERACKVHAAKALSKAGRKKEAAKLRKIRITNVTEAKAADAAAYAAYAYADAAADAAARAAYAAADAARAAADAAAAYADAARAAAAADAAAAYAAAAADAAARAAAYAADAAARKEEIQFLSKHYVNMMAKFHVSMFG